jgi:hypothetical protein
VLEQAFGEQAVARQGDAAAGVDDAKPAVPAVCEPLPRLDLPRRSEPGYDEALRRFVEIRKRPAEPLHCSLYELLDGVHEVRCVRLMVPLPVLVSQCVCVRCVRCVPLSDGRRKLTSLSVCLQSCPVAVVAGGEALIVRDATPHLAVCPADLRGASLRARVAWSRVLVLTVLLVWRMSRPPCAAVAARRRLADRRRIEGAHDRSRAGKPCPSCAHCVMYTRSAACIQAAAWVQAQGAELDNPQILKQACLFATPERV